MQEGLNQKEHLFIEKMRQEKLQLPLIDTFLYYYRRLCKGYCGTIFEQDIDPIQPDELPDFHTINGLAAEGCKYLNQAVIVKLNGGLGTTMGLEKAKSLIWVKNNHSFLDITAQQIRTLNRSFNTTIPLILMNSFKTETDSLKVLSDYPDLKTAFPFSFLQNKFPKVLQDTLEPAICDYNPVLEWNPPGHGDIFTALFTSGILENLIQHNIKYAFVSNIDNLGATIDIDILEYFAKNKFSFMMEVTDRTHMDRKGGHLAKNKDGKLLLREAAQCAQQDRDTFSNTAIHKYFNTNNLWINLISLHNLLKENNNQLKLPMITNTKKLDPKKESSPLVYQIEYAMGSAISVFDNSCALKVPRTRFAPVKSCEDLLLLWSDYYILTDDYKIVINPKRTLGPVTITLDPKYYSQIEQLQERFPHGAPSLVNCSSLNISGNVIFGKNVVLKGKVTVTNNRHSSVFIEDSSEIDSEITFN